MVTNRYDYQQEARAGLELLAKRLEKLMEDSTEIGHITGATTFQSDADSVKATLGRSGLMPEPEEARTGDRLMLRTGLRLLAHNLKAASGSVKATLGRSGLMPEPEEARTGDRLMLRTGLRLLAH